MIGDLLARRGWLPGWAGPDQQAMGGYRYRAVREVLGGSPIGEVAARYGASRQSLHGWRRRFVLEGWRG